MKVWSWGSTQHRRGRRASQCVSTVRKPFVSDQSLSPGPLLGFAQGYQEMGVGAGREIAMSFRAPLIPH